MPDLRGEPSRNARPNVARPQSLPPAESQNANTAATETAAATPLEAATPRAERKSNAPPGFISEIHKVSLTGGNFRFLGRANESVANFEGVRFRASISDASALHGNARVTKVALRDRFFLEQLRSPLRYDENGLDLSQISAHVGSGDLSGRFSMQPETDESPFRVEMKFRGVQAAQIISEAGGPSGVLQGKLEGTLQTEGKTTDPDALSGASGTESARRGERRRDQVFADARTVLAEPGEPSVRGSRQAWASRAADPTPAVLWSNDALAPAP